MPPSLYKYSEYFVAKRVCSVSKSVNFAKAARMYDMAHPLGSNWRDRKDWTMTKSSSRAKAEHDKVMGEHDQGLRKRARCLRV